MQGKRRTNCKRTAPRDATQVQSLDGQNSILKQEAALAPGSSTATTQDSEDSREDEMANEYDILTNWEIWSTTRHRTTRLLTLSPSIREKSGDPTDVDCVKSAKQSTATNNMLTDSLAKAGRLEKEGKLDNAIKMYHICLDQPCHVDRGHLHFRLGVANWKAGAYELGLKHIDEAVGKYKNDVAAVAELTASYISKGRIHLSMGDRQEARKNFRLSLSSLQDSSKEDCVARLQYARALHALGTTYKGCDCNRAIRYCREAVVLQKTLTGCDTDVATTLTTLGSLYEQKALYPLAINCLTEAYRMYSRSTCGSAPVDMGAALTRIGWLHFVSGKLSASLSMYREAMKLLKPLGAHRNVATLKFQIGKVYLEQGKIEKACSFYRDTLNMQCTVLGDKHEDVAKTSTALASAQELLGHTVRAAEYLQQAIQIRRVAVGTAYDLLLGENLVQLGQLYKKGGDKESCFRCSRDAILLYRTNKLSQDDPRVVEAKILLRSLR